MPSCTFPADLDSFPAMMAFVRRGAEDAGFEAKLVGRILLACEEALVNVIRYAYGGGEGELEVELSAPDGRDGLQISIRDRGAPFDPLAREDPDLEQPPETREIGGLGIFMLKRYMDRVEYERDGDRNVLTMKKFR